MTTRICPHKLRNGLPCDNTCVYKGYYTDRKTGERYMSCYFSHRRLPEDEDYEAGAKPLADIKKSEGV